MEPMKIKTYWPLLDYHHIHSIFMSLMIDSKDDYRNGCADHHVFKKHQELGLVVKPSTIVVSGSLYLSPGIYILPPPSKILPCLSHLFGIISCSNVVLFF